MVTCTGTGNDDFDDDDDVGGRGGAGDESDDSFSSSIGSLSLKGQDLVPPSPNDDDGGTTTTTLNSVSPSPSSPPPQQPAPRTGPLDRMLNLISPTTPFASASSASAAAIVPKRIDDLPFGSAVKIPDGGGSALHRTSDGRVYVLDEGGERVRVYETEDAGGGGDGGEEEGRVRMLDKHRPDEVHVIEEGRTPGKIKEVLEEFSEFFVRLSEVV